MKKSIKVLTIALMLLNFAPVLPALCQADAETKTEVITVYEYKEHPITPNDYLFRTVFWGACLVVIVTVLALLHTMVRMEELRHKE